ncbi:hypothetical protein Y880_0252901 [Pseudomonas aeruginosa PAK]|nr:hypothetical protein Y880_0252901 [Pseudomonas aeruginosa PAK]
MRSAKTCLCLGSVKRCHHCFCNPGTKQTNHSSGCMETGDPSGSTSIVSSSGTPGICERPSIEERGLNLRGRKSFINLPSVMCVPL